MSGTPPPGNKLGTGSTAETVRMLPKKKNAVRGGDKTGKGKSKAAAKVDPAAAEAAAKAKAVSDAAKLAAWKDNHAAAKVSAASKDHIFKLFEKMEVKAGDGEYTGSEPRNHRPICRLNAPC